MRMQVELQKTPIPLTPALDIPTMIEARIESIIGKNSTECLSWEPK